MSADTITLTPAERRQSAAAAIACMAIFGVTMAMSTPMIGLILESRDVSRTAIGALGAVPALSLILTNPFIPMVVRKLGFRPFIFGCIVMELILVLLMPVLDSLPAWFILRALMGMSVNGLFVASETWINMVTEDRNRGRVIAIYGMALYSTFAIGPFLVNLTGIEGYLPWLVIAGFIVLASVPLIWTRKLPLEVEGRGSFSVLSFFFVAPTLLAAVFLSAFKEMSNGTLLPVFAVRSGFVMEDANALLSTAYVGGLLMQFPLGWVADRVNRYGLLITLIAIGLIGCLLLPTMMAWHNLFTFVGIALWVGLFSGVYVVTMTIIGQRFKGTDLVTANAANGVMWGLGHLSGPTMAGIAMDIWDPNGFAWTLAAVTFVILVIAIYQRIRRRQLSRSDD